MSRGRNPARMLDADMKAEIREVFDIFDADKSGTIDRHELKVGLRAMGFDITTEEINQLMAENDPNGLGYLDGKAFEKVILYKMQTRDEIDEIRRIFKMFQRTEKAGYIYLDDLKTIVKETGLEYTDEECREMFDAFDTDGTGRISEAQFIDIIEGGTRSVH
ncbi:EF hand family protein [Trichomonas vaginalis G3]|uniref:EF hand family protein n=1 Tax=Trichomonas vaginalis (strain ATCC PRA-98 / G3) TaxID=412133 RepID=A2DY15_TRIV3|nr:calcium ion binding [Trichomonas vaginalis G3]EAY14751.1 EF hand family protein [Trichomonas vaginalis G3]KAI5487878.1 calcium ion binding [Trichomonas vaginalis G3]|eukprot:XP_001326974.1 EF hand family protein [Trichomonas vaginalis G3]